MRKNLNPLSFMKINCTLDGEFLMLASAEILEHEYDTGDIGFLVWTPEASTNDQTASVDLKTHRRLWN